MARRVAIVALEGAVTFDVAAPLQVFAPVAGPGVGLYEVLVATPNAAPVRTWDGLTLGGGHSLEVLGDADLVVVAGTEPADPVLSGELPGLLSAALARGARVLSICTGAFVLARAGLLDGRRATTHWRQTDLLSSRYPAVDVEPRVLFVDDDPVLTSAGLAAGIDPCLYVVRRDFGAAIANAVARETVVAPYREGGQAQFIERPVPASSDTSLAATRAFMIEYMSEPLLIDQLARHALMSRRSFTRAFRAETGTSPHQWLATQRILRARELLERSDQPVEEIARATGFNTPASFRLHFRQVLHTSPSAYRRAFRAPTDAAKEQHQHSGVD